MKRKSSVKGKSMEGAKKSHLQSSEAAQYSAAKRTLDTLKGDLPFFRHPAGTYCDDGTQQVFLYTHNDDKSMWHLFCIDMKSYTARDLTKMFRYVVQPKSASLISDELHEPLPSHRGASGAFFQYKSHRVLLIFGGQPSENGPCTSALYVLNLDTHRWSRVAPEYQSHEEQAVVPRAFAASVMVQGRFFVFGGFSDYGEGENVLLESYSIAEFNPETHGWVWTVRDKPYPECVPRKASFSNAAVVNGDGGRWILLVAGPPKTDPIGFDSNSKGTFVLYDTVHDAFHVRDDVQCPLPATVEHLAVSMSPRPTMSMPPVRAADPVPTTDSRAQEALYGSAAVMCVWPPSSPVLGIRSPGSLCPDMWMISLYPDNCQGVGLREKLVPEGVSVCAFFVIGSRLILLGTKSGVWAVQQVINVVVEVNL